MNIPLNIDFLQILLHMLNFVILAGGLTFLLFKPVSNFFETRKNYFADMENKNREASEENERLRLEYEQRIRDAEEEIQQRKKAAEKELTEASAQYLREAKDKAASIILAAEQEAEIRKEHILDSAQTEIGELVVTATQKLLSDTVTPQRNIELYDEFIRLAEDTVSGERSKHDKE
ncbi:MAG: ATP synthase F0 subunit B [Ruminococcaceae bacterium]|nr:ATP synthase F0 subunit B [Oscillospiraceae bacterium]